MERHDLDNLFVTFLSLTSEAHKDFSEATKMDRYEYERLKTIINVEWMRDKTKRPELSLSFNCRQLHLLVSLLARLAKEYEETGETPSLTSYYYTTGESSKAGDPTRFKVIQENLSPYALQLAVEESLEPEPVF